MYVIPQIITDECRNVGSFLPKKNKRSPVDIVEKPQKFAINSRDKIYNEIDGRRVNKIR